MNVTMTSSDNSLRTFCNKTAKKSLYQLILTAIKLSQLNNTFPHFFFGRGGVGGGGGYCGRSW